MNGKKKIASITVAAIMTMSICVGATSSFAANYNDSKKIDSTQVDAKVQTTKAVVKKPQTHEDLAAIAAKFGIKIDGMPDEQIEAALVAFKQSHQNEIIDPAEKLQAIARELKIDTTGMTEDQIKAAVNEKGKDQKIGVEQTLEDLTAIAKEMGIDTTGKTKDQIEAALIAYKESHQKEAGPDLKLQSIARELKIDTTGMTDDQIRAAVKEKGQDQRIKVEPTIEELTATANELGIDTTGKTKDQIETALYNYKLSRATKEDLQAMTGKMGIDTTGMSDEQVKAAIIEKLITAEKND